eukprot:COSAG04_NODE_5284_length_1673_cov_1.207116_2_plen_151_part_00
MFTTAKSVRDGAPSNRSILEIVSWQLRHELVPIEVRPQESLRVAPSEQLELASQPPSGCKIDRLRLLDLTPTSAPSELLRVLARHHAIVVSGFLPLLDLGGRHWWAEGSLGPGDTSKAISSCSVFQQKAPAQPTHPHPTVQPPQVQPPRR